MQHGINCRREESQISERGDATIRKKAPNPFHLIRREAVSFASLSSAQTLIFEFKSSHPSHAVVSETKIPDEV